MDSRANPPRREKYFLILSCLGSILHSIVRCYSKSQMRQRTLHHKVLSRVRDLVFRPIGNSCVDMITSREVFVWIPMESATATDLLYASSTSLANDHRIRTEKLFLTSGSPLQRSGTESRTLLLVCSTSIWFLPMAMYAAASVPFSSTSIAFLASMQRIASSGVSVSRPATPTASLSAPSTIP